MKRVISFRIYDTATGAYLNPEKWVIKANGEVRHVADPVIYTSVILEQFTGLTDKYGVEIYEGDVVKDEHGRIMRIGYHNHHPCFIAITDTNFHHADFFDWCKYGEMNDDNPSGITSVVKVEVIGNIHTNPELTP